MKIPARSIVWTVLLLLSIAAEAQTKEQIDSSALHTQLHNKGTFEGHVRTFAMATVNRREYPDYYAWAIGAGLSYRTPVLYNFQVGLSGFIIHNITSSDLMPANGFSNRYEIGLFDINDPKNHSDLDRLEDLYVRYYLKKDLKSFVQLGKFHLITPLINLQDGRMRPNMQEGIWMQWTSF
ncbi:MAG: hypothetical protein HC859_01165 [Bacteroidia bacterium]|nr:hypothetical protein [Bacteroidia bacterium]